MLKKEAIVCVAVYEKYHKLNPKYTFFFNICGLGLGIN